MKIGDLVTLKEQWRDERVSACGIVIDLEENFYTGLHHNGRATVMWFNDIQTFEPTVALEILSEL